MNRSNAAVRVATGQVAAGIFHRAFVYRPTLPWWAIRLLAAWLGMLLGLHIVVVFKTKGEP